MTRTKPWKVSEEVWERIRPFIPPRPARPKGGRPPADDRTMFEAIVYVLRTGIQWNALPRELAASSTVYDRFRLWERQEVFEHLWEAGLQEFDAVEGLEWQWQSLDGTQIKAPFGGAATGRNPVERGKRGTKRSQLSEGHGLPLAVVLEAANRPDMVVAAATLDAIMITRPPTDEAHPQHLCLDAGYDYPSVLEAASERGYHVHVRPNWWNRNHGKLPLRSSEPTPPSISRASDHDGGWWNASTPGSIATVVSSFAGISSPVPTWPFSAWPMRSSAFSRPPAFRLARFRWPLKGLFWVFG